MQWGNPVSERHVSYDFSHMWILTFTVCVYANRYLREWVQTLKLNKRPREASKRSWEDGDISYMWHEGGKEAMLGVGKGKR